MSRINGSLLERTHQAMLAAFSRREDLRQFVSLQLDEHFDVLVRDDNLRVQAYELLLWAGRNGREVELLDKLAAERPRETTFVAVAEALRSGAALLPPEALAARLPGGGAVPLQKPLRVQHFTGRDLELARLLADLQPGQALTLCGPGGMGKTALAAEAVWRLAPGDGPPDRFPDGVIFHTFYHQPQADVALEGIARAYGVDPRPSPREAARLALANRKALLILDGAEAADDLESVLAVAGTCGVLITSQRHSDAPAASQDIAPLPDSESLRLLRAWAGTYAGEENAPGASAANEIVRLLGGLPLALFLVGRYLAQRRQRPVEYLPWLAAQGLEALHFGERRSKSVPLLLQRSLEQVSKGARAAFGVAGVLALAPFETEPVAAALEITVPAAHRVLGELVDYGLLLRPDMQYQVTHALAHGYARTRAIPDGGVIGRLALYYAGLAERESGRGLAGYAVLDTQRAHIIAVQTAALTAEQWAAVREVTRQARDYLDLRGYWTELVAVVQAGLDAAKVTGDRYDELEFTYQLGAAYYALGETQRAIKLYELALGIARDLGNRRGEGAILGNLGVAYYALGETQRAIEFHELELGIARELGNRRLESKSLGNLGVAYYILGEVHRAVELYEQQLEIAREIGDRRAESNALGNLGLTYAALGENRRAIEFYEKDLAFRREIGDRLGEGKVLGNLGLAYAALGETHRARESHEKDLAIRREIGDRRGEGKALNNLGLAYAALGDPSRAIGLYEQQMVIAREIGDRRGEAEGLYNLGYAYLLQNQTDLAISCLQEALPIFEAIGSPSTNLTRQILRELDAVSPVARSDYTDYLALYKATIVHACRNTVAAARFQASLDAYDLDPQMQAIGTKLRLRISGERNQALLVDGLDEGTAMFLIDILNELV